MSSPEVSVVVASHERPIRLRWLLNALEDQTLDRERFEVVVAHDSGDETEALLCSHPLAASGVLRHLRFAPGPGPAAKRNAGWRAARAPLVAFTDDDCRVAPDWLEALLSAAHRTPGAVVQGATFHDPFETDIFKAPHVRWVALPDPPGPDAQTCNILYPRDALEATGGFDETMPVAAGEDTDLALRARARGAGYVGAPDAQVFHAVEEFSLLGMIRLNWRWQHLAYLARRHPRIRRHWTLGVFWRPTHLELLAALAGAAAVRRQPLAILLATPYLRRALSRRGRGRRARAVCVAELPGRATVELAEVVTMLRGSVRYRTLVL